MSCTHCGAHLVAAARCAGCGREIPPNRAACAYCGGTGGAGAAPTIAPVEAGPEPGMFDRSDAIDIALLLLAMPVMVWGLLIVGIVQLALIVKGAKFTVLRTIANPRPLATIPPALIALLVSYLMFQFSDAGSSWFVRYGFFIMLASAVFGAALLIRRAWANRPRERKIFER